MSQTIALTTEEFNEKIRNIGILLLDVDGVLTDGRLYFAESGSEFKSFNTLDGQGIKALRRSGVEVGIITGRRSQLVARRAADLGIELLIQGREDKYTAMQELLADRDFALSQIAFLGDDYPDLSVMTRVGLSLSVANAHPEVVCRSHYQTQRRGGEGAVREVCDLIMRSQGTYDRMLASYIQPLVEPDC